MSHWQHGTPEADRRLSELAELFTECRKMFFDIAQDEFHWEPASDSLASVDLANTERGPAGLWGEAPVHQMVNVVANYLLIATGHLGALAILHAGQEVLLSPPLLVRAVIENCARAIWVLAIDDPRSTKTRVARAYLEEWLSAEEAKTVSGRMSDKTSAQYKDATDRYRHLRDAVLPGRFDGVTRESLGTRELAGQRLPSPEACVVWMYEQISAIGGGVSAREGRGAYGFLCNMTHPTLYPVRDMTGWREVKEGHPESILTLDLSFLDRLAGAAVVAFFNAMSLLMSYMGWHSVRRDEWERHVNETLPGTFTD